MLRHSVSIIVRLFTIISADKSSFLLGQVVGSIVLSPWSETFGRKKLYIVSSALSCICCVIVGVVPHIAAVIVARVAAGLLSAIPYTVASGSTEDLFNSRERIWVIFGWTVASNCGLIIGPIMGTHIIAGLGWYALLFLASRKHTNAETGAGYFISLPS